MGTYAALYVSILRSCPSCTATVIICSVDLGHKLEWRRRFKSRRTVGTVQHILRRIQRKLSPLGIARHLKLIIHTDDARHPRQRSIRVSYSEIPMIHKKAEEMLQNELFPSFQELGGRPLSWWKKTRLNAFALIPAAAIGLPEKASIQCPEYMMPRNACRMRAIFSHGTFVSDTCGSAWAKKTKRNPHLLHLIFFVSSFLVLISCLSNSRMSRPWSFTVFYT